MLGGRLNGNGGNEVYKGVLPLTKKNQCYLELVNKMSHTLNNEVYNWGI